MHVSPNADPLRGVFETLLVIDGRPVELEAHLERLATSLRAIFGAAPPAETRQAVLDGAAAVKQGKLRLSVEPSDDTTLSATVRATEIAPPLTFPAMQPAVALRPFVAPGGLGAHKWADRSLLERAERATPEGELPLLIDRDGAVLEAARGSLFAARAGALLTPPADGRILPGITRRRVLEAAREGGLQAREQQLGLDDLHRASEVFLAGSVRGIEPVRVLDGNELGAARVVSAQIAARLRRRWLPVPQAGPVATVAVGRRGDRRAR